MGLADEPLVGFSTVQRKYTMRLAIWSDVFLAEHNDDKTAIILADMEGLQYETTGMLNEQDNIFIFALGSLISSTLIYNTIIPRWNFLKQSTNFAQLISEKPTNLTSIPFQCLVLLMRDWDNADGQYEFGWDSGKTFVEKNIKETKNVHYIESTFSKHVGFLMPKPGSMAKDNHLGSYDADFVKHLRIFVERIFSKNILKKKYVDGSEMTGKKYREFIKENLLLFQSYAGKTPEDIITSVFEFHTKAAIKVYENTRAMKYQNGLSTHSSHQEAAVEALDFLQSFDLKTTLTSFNFHRLTLLRDMEQSHDRWVKNIISEIHFEIGILCLGVVPCLLTTLIYEN